MVRFIKDPWFNLGIHLDHKVPYIALHFPGITIWFGKTLEPAYVVSCDKDIWAIMRRKPTKEEKKKIKEKLSGLIAEKV